MSFYLRLSQVVLSSPAWIFGSFRWLFIARYPLFLSIFSLMDFLSAKFSSFSQTQLFFPSILKPLYLGAHGFTSIFVPLSHCLSHTFWSFGRFGFILVFCFFTYNLFIPFKKVDAALFYILQFLANHQHTVSVQ